MTILQPNKLKELISSFFVFILLSGSINAKTTTAIVNGQWTDASTWNNGTPAAWDIAIIPAGIVVDVSGANGTTFENIVVQVSGGINLENGQKLRLDCNSLFELTSASAELSGENGGSKLQICSVDEFTGGGASMRGPASLGRNPLPIELTSFNLNINGNTISINWETVTETNNDYFTIEKSIDGINFNIVAEIKGAGNSTSNLSYSFIDKAPTNGTSYYRLKQTDFDGRFEYSSIIHVNFQKQILDSDVVLYPNPCLSCNEINLVVSNDVSDELNVELFDVSGRVVKTSNINRNQSGLFLLDIQNSVSAGVYYLKIESGNSIVKKIVIQ